MSEQAHSFSAAMWQWEVRDASWQFVTLPQEVADAIDDAYQGPRRGFGSIKVRVVMGETRWETSIFPSKEEESFVLPIKKAVRVAEGVEDGDTVTLTVTVLD